MQHNRLFYLIAINTLLQVAATFGFAYADTRYVSDMLILTLRDQPSDDCRVIGTLKTNDSVEVLEENTDYCLIRTTDGEKGWAARKYITTKKPKPLIIEELEKEIDWLTTALKEKEKRVVKLSADLKEMTDRYNTFLHQSKDAVAMGNQPNGLRDTIDNVRSKNERLMTENKNLKSKNSRFEGTGKPLWFMAGAGVFLLGLTVGKISTRNKKRIFY